MSVLIICLTVQVTHKSQISKFGNLLDCIFSSRGFQRGVCPFGCSGGSGNPIWRVPSGSFPYFCPYRNRVPCAARAHKSLIYTDKNITPVFLTHVKKTGAFILIVNLTVLIRQPAQGISVRKSPILGLLYTLLKCVSGNKMVYIGFGILKAKRRL